MEIEVCVDSLASVHAAAAAGADRIELCSALSEGGLTPTIGFLQQARKIFSGTIVYMVRPRRGDFVYSEDELEQMVIDMEMADKYGADEYVYGCLDTDGTVDREACDKLAQAAGGRPRVFHRAFDVSSDLFESLETIIELGFHRILTSGGNPTAVEGASKIAALIQRSAGRIDILPGGGITATTAMKVIEKTGADQLHLSGREIIPSTMQFKKPEIPMGADSISGEYEHNVTATKNIRKVIAQLAEMRK